MQDHLSYKLNCVINNWFDYAYELRDYDSNYHYEKATTFYCATCAIHKDIKLRKVVFDSMNRKRYRCITCFMAITRNNKNVK